MSKSVVSALLYNPRGQILLQHRDDNPYTVFPGHWGLFSGGVEDGENLEEALDREIWEELEYKVQHKELWLIAREARATFHMFVVPIDVELEQPRLNEGQGFGYFEIPEALSALRLPPVTRYALQTFELHQAYQDEAKLYTP
jgi:8-oxo-dGTP pyrophosphatase MutT (NUDIX family)